MRRLFGPQILVGLALSVSSCASESTESSSDAGSNDEDGATSAACPAPDTQVLDAVHGGATLKFVASAGESIRYGTSSDIDRAEPSEWILGDELVLPKAAQRLRVFAEVADCNAARRFDHVYQVREEYEPQAGEPESSAIGLDEGNFQAWATGFDEPVQFGSDVDEEWRDPERALGPAEGTTLDAVSLGNGGQIELTFDPPIKNGDGPDFAVFENSFSDDFLELGFVEVSSDGEHFVRFDSAYLGKKKLDAYATQRAELIGALAGKYRAGFGTPFDLELLRYRSLVARGEVNLDRITHVRIVDIVGDGSAKDSFGQPIYDPTPTVGSAGFDLDGVGVIHQAN